MGETIDITLRTLVDNSSLGETKDALLGVRDELVESPVSGMKDQLEQLRSTEINSFIPNFGQEFANQVSVVSANVDRLLGLYDKIGKAQTKLDRETAVESYLNAVKRADIGISELQNALSAAKNFETSTPAKLKQEFIKYYQNQNTDIRSAFRQASSPNKSGFTVANGQQIIDLFTKGFISKSTNNYSSDFATFMQQNGQSLATALMPLMATGFNREDLYDAFGGAKREKPGSVRAMLPEKFRNIAITQNPEYKQFSTASTPLTKEEYADLERFILSEQGLLEEFELSGLAKRVNGRIKLGKNLTREHIHGFGGRLVSLFESGARGIAPRPEDDITDVNDPKYLERIVAKNNIAIGNATRGMRIASEYFPWIEPEYIQKPQNFAQQKDIGKITAGPRYKAGSFYLLPFNEGGMVENIPVANSLMQQRLSAIPGADPFVHNARNTNEIYVKMPVEELQDFETTPERRAELRAQIAKHIGETKEYGGYKYRFTGFTGANAAFTREDLFNAVTDNGKDLSFFTNGEKRREFTSGATFGKAVDYMAKQRTEGENISDLYGTDLKKLNVVVADWKELTGADGKNLISHKLVPASFQGRDVSGKSTYFTFSEEGLRKKYANRIVQQAVQDYEEDNIRKGDLFVTAKENEGTKEERTRRILVPADAGAQFGDLYFDKGGVNGGHLVIPRGTNVIEDYSNIKVKSQYDGMTQQEINAARTAELRDTGIFAKTTAADASTPARYISSQAASSLSLSPKAREYFRNTYLERMRMLDDPESVKALLFSGEDALSRAINSPGGEALLYSEEAQKVIAQHRASITQSVANGNLLLPQGIGKYNMLGAWLPDIFNALIPEDQLTAAQKAMSLGDKAGSEIQYDPNDPMSFIAHRVAYFKSAADNLFTMRNPDTASGNQAVKNLGADEFFQQLASDLGMDKEALYVNPASKITEKWQTADFDGDTVLAAPLIKSLKSMGGFGDIMMEVLAQTAQDYANMISLSGRTQEEQEIFAKSREKSIEEPGRTYRIDSPEDMAYWFDLRQQPGSKMGFAHSTTIGARQLPMSGLVARAIMNAEDHYDVDSNGLYKQFKEFETTQDEWDVIGKGNPFYRLVEWRDKAITSPAGVGERQAQHQEKFNQDFFNKKKIDAVNFASIHDPHGIGADFNMFFAANMHPGSQNLSVPGGDWGSIFANMPETSEIKEVAALQNRLRELRLGKLQGEYLAFDDSLVNELGMLSNNALAAITENVGKTSLSEKEKALEIERQFKAAGGYVPKHLKEWGLTRSNIEANPELKAEVDKAINLYGEDRVYAKSDANTPLEMVFYSPQEMARQHKEEAQRRLEEAKKEKEQQELEKKEKEQQELEKKETEQTSQIGNAIVTTVKSIPTPSKKTTPQYASNIAYPKKPSSNFGPQTAQPEAEQAPSAEKTTSEIDEKIAELEKQVKEYETLEDRLKDLSTKEGEYNRIVEESNALVTKLRISAKGKENKIEGRTLAQGYFNQLFYGEAKPMLDTIHEFTEENEEFIKANPEMGKMLGSLDSQIKNGVYRDFSDKAALYAKEYADTIQKDYENKLSPPSAQKKKMDEYLNKEKETQGFIDGINGILNNPNIILTQEMIDFLGEKRKQAQESLTTGGKYRNLLTGQFTKENEQNAIVAMESLQGQLGLRNKNSLEVQTQNRLNLIQQRRDAITQNFNEGFMTKDFYDNQMALLSQYEESAAHDIIKQNREALGLDVKTPQEKRADWIAERQKVLEAERDLKKRDARKEAMDAYKQAKKENPNARFIDYGNQYKLAAADIDQQYLNDLNAVGAEYDKNINQQYDLRNIQNDQHLLDLSFRTDLAHEQRLHQMQRQRQNMYLPTRSRIANAYRQADDMRFNYRQQIATNERNIERDTAIQKQQTKAFEENYGMKYAAYMKLSDEQKRDMGSGAMNDAAKIASTAENLRSYQSALQDAQQGMKGFSSAGAVMSAGLNTVNTALTRVLHRFGRQMFYKAINEAKRFVQDFDKSMMTIQMITLKTDDQMSVLGDSLITKAKDLKVAISDLSKIEETLYRQGLSDSEVQERETVITKFSKVAGIDPEAATKLVTVATNTGLATAQEATDIVTALGDKAATNAKEIEKGIEKSAAAAKMDGTTFAELASMLTAITSTTQLGGNVAGRTLTSIFGRMNKIGTNELIYDENGNAISDSTISSLLKEQGINTYENGKKRSTYSILYDLSQVWDSLDDASQSQLSYAIAATRNYSNFGAIIQGMSEGKVDEYMKLTADSTGITDEKYEIYTKTLQAALTDLKNTWDSVIHDLIDSGALKQIVADVSGIIQVLGDVIKNLTKIKGLAPTIITLFTTIQGAKLGGWVGAGIGLVGGLLLSNQVSSASQRYQEQQALKQYAAENKQENVYQKEKAKNVETSDKIEEAKALRDKLVSGAATEADKEELSSLMQEIRRSIGDSFGDASDSAEGLSGTFGTVAEELETYANALIQKQRQEDAQGFIDSKRSVMAGAVRNPENGFYYGSAKGSIASFTEKINSDKDHEYDKDYTIKGNIDAMLREFGFSSNLSHLVAEAYGQNAIDTFTAYANSENFASDSTYERQRQARQAAENDYDIIYDALLSDNPRVALEEYVAKRAIKNGTVEVDKTASESDQIKEARKKLFVSNDIVTQEESALNQDVFSIGSETGYNTWKNDKTNAYAMHASKMLRAIQESGKVTDLDSLKEFLNETDENGNPIYKGEWSYLARENGGILGRMIKKASTDEDYTDIMNTLISASRGQVAYVSDSEKATRATNLLDDILENGNNKYFDYETAYAEAEKQKETLLAEHNAEKIEQARKIAKNPDYDTLIKMSDYEEPLDIANGMLKKDDKQLSFDERNIIAYAKSLYESNGFSDIADIDSQIGKKILAESIANIISSRSDIEGEFNEDELGIIASEIEDDYNVDEVIAQMAAESTYDETALDYLKGFLGEDLVSQLQKGTASDEVKEFARLKLSNAYHGISMTNRQKIAGIDDILQKDKYDRTTALNYLEGFSGAERFIDLHNRRDTLKGQDLEDYNTLLQQLKNYQQDLQVKIDVEGTSALESAGKVLEGTAATVEKLKKEGVIKLEVITSIRSEAFTAGQTEAKLNSGTWSEQNAAAMSILGMSEDEFFLDREGNIAKAKEFKRDTRTQTAASWLEKYNALDETETEERNAILEAARLEGYEYDNKTKSFVFNPSLVKKRAQSTATITNRYANEQAESDTARVYRKITNEYQAAKTHSLVNNVGDFIGEEDYKLLMEQDPNFKAMVLAGVGEDELLAYAKMQAAGQTGSAYDQYGTAWDDLFGGQTVTEETLAKARAAYANGGNKKSYYDLLLNSLPEDVRKYITASETEVGTISAANTIRAYNLEQATRNRYTNGLGYAQAVYDSDNVTKLAAQAAWETRGNYTDIGAFLNNAKNLTDWNELEQTQEYLEWANEYLNADRTGLAEGKTYEDAMRAFSNMTMYNAGAGYVSREALASTATRSLSLAANKRKDNTDEAKAIRTILGEDAYSRWINGEDINANGYAQQKIANYGLGLSEFTTSQKLAGIKEITGKSGRWGHNAALREYLSNADNEAYADEVMAGFSGWSEYKALLKNGETGTDRFKVLQQELEQFQKETQIEFDIEGIQSLEKAGEVLEGTTNYIEQLKKDGRIEIQAVIKMTTEYAQQGQIDARLNSSDFATRAAAIMEVTGATEEQYYNNQEYWEEQAQKVREAERPATAASLSSARKETEDKDYFDNNIAKAAGYKWVEYDAKTKKLSGEEGYYEYDENLLREARTGYNFDKQYTNAELVKRAKALSQTGLGWNEIVNATDATGNKKYNTAELEAIKSYSPDLYKWLSLSETQRASTEGQNLERKFRLQFKVEGINELEEAGELLEGTAELVEQLSKGGTFEIEARIKLGSDLFNQAQLDAMLNSGNQYLIDQAAQQITGTSGAYYQNNRDRLIQEAQTTRTIEHGKTASSLMEDYKAAEDKQAFLESLTGTGWSLQTALDENGHRRRQFVYNPEDYVFENPYAGKEKNYTAADYARMRANILNGTLTTGQVGYEAAFSSGGERWAEYQRLKEAGVTGAELDAAYNAMLQEERITSREAFEQEALDQARLNATSAGGAYAYAQLRYKQNNKAGLAANNIFAALTSGNIGTIGDLAKVVSDQDVENWEDLLASSDDVRKAFDDMGAKVSDDGKSIDFSNVSLEGDALASALSSLVTAVAGASEDIKDYKEVRSVGEKYSQAEAFLNGEGNFDEGYEAYSEVIENSELAQLAYNNRKEYDQQLEAYNKQQEMLNALSLADRNAEEKRLAASGELLSKPTLDAYRGLNTDIERRYANIRMENAKYGRSELTDVQRYEGLQDILAASKYGNVRTLGKIGAFADYTQGIEGADDWFKATEILQENNLSWDAIKADPSKYENVADALHDIYDNYDLAIEANENFEDAVSEAGLKLRTGGKYLDAYSAGLKRNSKSIKEANAAQIKENQILDEILQKQYKRTQFYKGKGSTTEIAAMTGRNKADISKKENKADIEEQLKSQEQEDLETINSMLEGQTEDLQDKIKAYYEENHIEVDTTGLEIDIKTGGVIINDSQMAEICGAEVAAQMRAIAAAMNGQGVETQYEKFNGPNGEPQVRVIARSLGEGRKGGGGGGGGKSKIDELLESQKRKVAVNEHEIKMLQIEEKDLDYSNDYDGQVENINKQIDAQYKLRQVYADNIKEMQEMLKTTKEGSDDWYKLRDAIYAAEEAFASINSTINETAQKQISALEQKQQIEDKPGAHKQSMLEKLSSRAMTEDRFADYVNLTQQRIEEINAQRSLNDTQLAEWEKELENYEEGSDAWQQTRDKIWAIEEENAELENQSIQQTMELNQQRLAQIAKVLERDNGAATHNQNIASAYSGLYETGGYRGSYEEMIREQKSSNDTILSNTRAALIAAQAEMDALEEGTPSWYEARNAVYQYQEAIAQATVSQESLNRAMAESKIAEVEENYSDATREVYHVNDLLDARAQEFLENNDYQAYNQASSMYIENLDTALTAENNALSSLTSQYNAGMQYTRLKERLKNSQGGSAEYQAIAAQIARMEKENPDITVLDPAMQREYQEKMNERESKIQQMQIDRRKRQKELDKTNLDYLFEQQDRAASDYQHNLSLVQYQQTKYQNAEEWTNYGRGIEVDTELRKKRVAALDDEIEALKEQQEYYKNTYGPGTDEEERIVDQIKKREEARESENVQIEKNTKLLEENRKKIMQIQKTIEDSVDKEIEAEKKRQREILSANVSMQNTILDLVKKAYQERWEMQKKDIEREKESLNEYKKLITERFNYRKKASQQADKDEEIADYRRQLALIEADPTRTKDAKELRRKIDELEKDKSWNLAEDELNNETDRIDENIAGMDRFIQFEEEKLNDLLSNANNFAEELGEVLSGSFEESYQKILDYMNEANESFMKSLPDAQKQMVQGWEDTWKKANDIVDVNYNKITDVLKDKDSYVNYMKETNRDYRALAEELDKLNPKNKSDAEEIKRLQNAMGLSELQWGEAYDKYVASTIDNAIYKTDEHPIEEVTSKIDELKDNIYSVNILGIEGTGLSATGFDNSSTFWKDRSNGEGYTLNDYAGVGKIVEQEEHIEETIKTESDKIGDKIDKKAESQKYGYKFTDQYGVSHDSGLIYDTEEAAKKAGTEVLRQILRQTATTTTLDSINKNIPNTEDFDVYTESDTKTSTTPNKTTTPDNTKNNKTFLETVLNLFGIKTNANGGVVDYTGLAWVDGTKTRPESFLDAVDTKLLREQLDAYKYVRNTPYMSNIDTSQYGNSTTVGDINITINEAEINSDQDINALAKRVGEAFTRELRINGVSTAGYSFA